VELEKDLIKVLIEKDFQKKMINWQGIIKNLEDEKKQFVIRCFQQASEIDRLKIEEKNNTKIIKVFEEQTSVIKKDHIKNLQEMQDQYVEKLTIKQGSTKKTLLSKHEVDRAIFQIQQLKEETVLKLKDEISQTRELKVQLNRYKNQIIKIKNDALTANQKQSIIAKDLKEEKLKVKKYKIMEEKYEELLTKYIILEKNNKHYRFYADSEISRLTLKVDSLIKESQKVKPSYLNYT